MAKMTPKITENGQDEAQDGQDEAQDGQDEAQGGQDGTQDSQDKSQEAPNDFLPKSTLYKSPKMASKNRPRVGLAAP